MRVAGILAFGALFGLACANVVCKVGSPLPEDSPPGSVLIEELHNHTALMNTESLCDAINNKDFVAHQLHSVLFTITRIGQDFDAGDCEAKFIKIIEECVHGQNFKGGSLFTDGLAYEVLHDVAPVPNVTSGLPDRTTRRKAVKTPSAPHKPGTTPKTTVPKGPAPKIPTTKSCPTKSHGGQKPKTKNTAKQNIEDTIYTLVSRLLQRSSPTPSEQEALEEAAFRCDDQPMAAGAGWGPTFFGFYKDNPSKPISRPRVQALAREKYSEVVKLTPDVTIVAALYIPGDGVYFGTIAHGVGEQKFASMAPSKAPKLWSKMSHRGKKPGETHSIYHAEDVAMYNYESQNAQVSVSERYPDGKYIIAYGRKSAGDTPKYWQPCAGDGTKIKPNCYDVLKALEIDFE